MRVSRSRPIVFNFIFAVGITLTLPYLAFGAGHSFGGFGRFRAPNIHREHSVSHPFNRFGFLGVGEVGEEPVIIIQQFLPAASTGEREPATNRIYVPPRWLDGGYGVEVLQPGYWIDPEQAAER